MVSHVRYRYRPLHTRETRIVSLKPSQEDNDIQLSLENVSLHDCISYEALSYTWGTSTDMRPLICNEAGDVVYVTRNCEKALRALRKKDEKRVLWIDALCIDQNNIEERNRQVQLMPDIYSQAERVIAFLGEASEDSDLAMDLIANDQNSMSRDSRPPIGSLQRRVIDNLLERTYFERAWILQEILLAQEITIMVGNRIMDWRAFSSVVFYVDTNKKLHLGEGYRNRVPAVVFWRDRSAVDRPQTLLDFLDKTRYCNSSDPRDKVFALLAMTPEKGEEGLRPDYGLSPRDVFLSVARFILVRDRNLDVLCQCEGTSSDHHLPSWAPDWSFHRVSKTLGVPKLSPRPYKADGGRTASIGFGENSECLILKGKVIDKIGQIGPTYHEEMNPAATIREWEAIALSSTRHVAIQDFSAAFMETLIAYPKYKGINPFGRFYDAWRATTLDQKTFERGSAGGAAIIQQMVNNKCHGRRLFVTGKGHIGIGPADISPNHVVTVLLGGQVPFVLSRTHQSYFNVVGECYLHGFMSGESFDSNEEIDTLHIV